MKSTHLNNLCSHIIPEEYGYDIFEGMETFLIPGSKQRISEMADIERRFISGLIRWYEPTNILEIGVSGGGGTAVILDAIKEMENSSLTSIDVAEYCYWDKNKKVGFVVEDYFPNLATHKWNLILGENPSDVLPQLNKKFDFVIIDSAHRHPVETLNFLESMPFMNNGSIVVLHDINLFRNAKKTAPRILWTSVVAKKLFPQHEYKMPRAKDTIPETINIGALQISDVTYEYIGNLFESLFLPWYIYPRGIENIMSFLSNHYDLELTKFLNKSIDYNHKLLVRIKAGLPPEEFSETSESTLQLEATDEKCITIPIVLVSNEDYSVPACVTIQSILMQKDINIAYNFIFMTDESLTEESKSIITDIVNAHSRASIRFLNVRELFSAIPFDTDISHLTKNVLFYVLMTPVLLLEYDKCLYMDVDIAVQGSLYDLYNINLDEYYVAAVPSLTVQHDDINYGDYHNVINIPDKKQYVNTGVMVMNLEAMRRDNLVHRFIEVTRNRPGRWYFQDAINIVCYGKILLLPLKYNVTAYEKLWERDTKDFLDVSPFYEQTEFEEAKDKPVIFHYVSRYKPWFSHLAYKSHYWYSALFSGSHMEKVYFRMRHKHQNISSNTGVKHSKIPRISVIVSVFNNVEYLERCIDSIINQTFKSLQIIIINDGSTDERVPSILNKYTAADERVRVIHKENAGSAAARNHGIELSQANYIAFVESDDYIAPTMYEKLYNLAESYKTDIVKCNFYQCFSKITRETNFFSKLGKTGVKFTLLERPKIYGLHASIWASLYRRSYLNDNSIRFIETPKATYSDFSWMVKTYATAKNIVVCAFHLYFYNYENPNSSFRAEDENCFYKPYHCDKAIDTLLEMSIFNEVHKYITPAIFRTCLGHAQYIRENLREEYFLKFRNVILKLKANGEDFSCLDKKSKILTDLLLKDDKNGFYNKVLRINNDYVFKETLVKLADKSIVFRIPYKVYQLGKRIILFPFNFHYVIERILLRVWKSRHEKNFKYALLKLASKCVCIVGLLIVAFFIMFVFMFLRLFGII